MICMTFNEMITLCGPDK